MSLPIVEFFSGLQESMFSLSRRLQLHLGKKSKNWSNFIKFMDFAPFHLFGVLWAAVIFPNQACLWGSYFLFKESVGVGWAAGSPVMGRRFPRLR